MKNKYFTEANAEVIKSKSIKEDFENAYIRREEGNCYSLWKGNLFDRIRFLIFGRIWIKMRSGETQPPVKVSTKYHVIENREEKQYRISRSISRRERRSKLNGSKRA